MTRRESRSRDRHFQIKVENLMLCTRSQVLSLLLSVPLLCQSSEDPYQTLKEAERLFWLDNWINARPLYAECERGFKQKGDVENELFAKFSRLRADSESTLSYPEVSRILAEDL